MAAFELSVAHFPVSATIRLARWVLCSLGRGTTPCVWSMVCASATVSFLFPYPWWRGWTFYNNYSMFLRSCFLHVGHFQQAFPRR